MELLEKNFCVLFDKGIKNKKDKIEWIIQQLIFALPEMHFLN